MSLLTNVVTFGASARVKSKIEEYEDQVEIYDASYKKMERLNHNLDEQINDLVLLKVEAINSLKKINKISKNLNGKERDALIRKVGNEFQHVNLELIENTLTTGQAAINATKGVASGAATALGAWALVSTIGHGFNGYCYRNT